MKNITLIILLFCAAYLPAQDDHYNIKNISENTEYADFGVTYYGDSTAVFASSRPTKSIRNRKWYGNQQPYLQLYKGTLDSEGEINELESFSKIINTKYHESNVAFTKDLKTVYFSRDNYINKKVTKGEENWVLIQLYKATVGEDGEWTAITAMPFNSDNYQTGHPALNAAEDKLYFTSDMPGTLGSTDIFVVSIGADGSYGEPVNLGPNVNTPGKEMFPFIDGNDILYFSSNGRLNGYGELDVYGTKIVNGEASVSAINLGKPVNSAADDFNLVYKTGEKWGHFSSNRAGGKGDDDIYYFEELRGLNFDCHQVAAGVVRDKATGALLPGATVELFDSKGKVVERTIADKYAAFSFKVDCSENYKVIGSKEDYIEDSEVFTTTDENELELALNLTLPTTEFVSIRGMLMININPIYFDLDKSFIRPDAAIELEKVVRIMKKYPQLIIASGSHTDSRASDDYNWDLSGRRSKSTLDWIIKRGIDPSRISGKGYGETQLVNDCDNNTKCSEAEHQLNRRTEFIVTNPETINEQ